ncbi:MAG: prolipoprotein diacylglyceryl transferase [Candidatus Aquicultor sp.]|nr:prolipoprotein diacylglyceryl transferase [Candidatus Aquicultor sp.]
MHPILFELALPDGTSLEVTSYRFAYMGAVFVALTIAWLLARRDGLPSRRSLAVLLVTAIALPVGARLWHAITNPETYANEPWRLWTLQASGHALFGGVFLASVAGVLAARQLRVDLWRLADAAAPALGAGIVVMRLGCFANGCCFGKLTDGPTGVTFPPGSYAHFWELAHGYIKLFEGPLPVHPAQLYEAAGALACVAVWAVVRRFRVPHDVVSDMPSGTSNGTARGIPDGVPFLSLVTVFAVVRTLNWTLRVPPDTLTEPGIYWPIYAATVAVCLALVVVRFVVTRRSYSTAPSDSTSANVEPLESQSRKSAKFAE